MKNTEYVPRVRIDRKVLNALQDYCKPRGIVFKHAVNTAVIEWLEKQREEERIAS